MLEKVKTFKEALKDKAKNVWVMKNLDPKKEDSIWYNGDNIIYVEFEDVDIFIQGIGDIYVEVTDENGEELEILRDKSNHGVEPTTFSNDEEMLKLIQEGRLEFHNNNWFETLYQFNDSDYVQSTYDIVDNVSDALDPDYILEILEYIRRNKNEIKVGTTVKITQKDAPYNSFGKIGTVVDVDYEAEGTFFQVQFDEPNQATPYETWVNGRDLQVLK